ncbi:Na+/H+ antiporter subunit E [Leucobacter luti]|uniref:Multisubunit sodium/proton antiporter MrpE subunit n=1 Tax=Leucobacter luti TaxID=340320 RepID=A0A4R6RZT3_9MICO|nr:Na+/H+ antiporter subunit E [Leucobacter luti]MCW2287541.1 multicomponent Na+:H+ antiporter subunit E [Leucobacter luti]QYM76422.1 Na+/H+ antiporter subunit E [Leucobacter luti]TCK46292.1 multisubunit sodium/proton antiporter MrpE subunit [Leucobacter luti]TDP92721.1 multisubunit sodium/proton antiporter MrpE subunit [Leucobacter luti]
MSETSTPPAGRRLEWGVRLHELPLLLGLVALWMMLWHEVSLLSLVSGVVIAIVVMRVFYLPPVELAGRFNPWYALRYLLYFFWHLAVASWQVAWLAVRPGPTPPTSIIAVRLRTRNDFILTVVGLTISLIPGSLVAEVDRFESTLYLHVLNTPTQRSITQMRHDVRHIERLLILALGSKQEIGALT